jgi:chlorophyll synthase
MARPALSAVTELFKPITWFPPMWAFACGVVASGVPMDGKWQLAICRRALAGPLRVRDQPGGERLVRPPCGRDQRAAAAHPFGPHAGPLGPVPGDRLDAGLAAVWPATAGCPGALRRQLLALVLAWAYSAPPVRLKENGWWGNAACGLSYEGHGLGHRRRRDGRRRDAGAAEPGCWPRCTARARTGS